MPQRLTYESQSVKKKHHEMMAVLVEYRDIASAGLRESQNSYRPKLFASHDILLLGRGPAV